MDSSDNSGSNSDESMDSSGDSGVATTGADKSGYEVEDIVGCKCKRGTKYFKIRWKNHDADQDTWECEHDLSCPKLIQRYLATHLGTHEIKKANTSMNPWIKIEFRENWKAYKLELDIQFKSNRKSTIF